MIATPRAARRAHTMSRRTRALGASAIALTGIMSSYLQVLRSPSAYASTTCSAVNSRTSLDTALGQVNAGTCDTITITGDFTLDRNPVAVDLVGGPTSSTLTINGGGFTVDGASSFRPFVVTLAAGESLSISDLTMINGYSAATGGTLLVNNGGGTGGSLTLDSVTIRDSRAGALASSPSKGASYEGGAVYVAGDDVTITSSTFTGNKGANGGAVYLDLDDYSTVLIQDSTFGGSAVGEGNESSDGGGALYIDNAGYSTVTGSTFTGNYGNGAGGAAYVYGNYSAVVENSTFTDNYSTDDGGALYIYQDDYDTDPLTPQTPYSIVRDSTFTGNHGDGGGALYNYSAPTLIDNVTFEDNESTGNGGAAMAWCSPGLIVRDSEFTNNTAEADGGAIFAESSLVISGSTFTGNVAGYNATSPYDGGAVYWGDFRGTATIDDSYFEGNSSIDDGGAIGGRGILEISDSTIIDNAAETNGGGIGTTNTLTLTNVSVLDNVAKVAGGGVHTTGTVTITNSTIAENTADDGAGVGRTGGVSAATLNLNFTTVKDNTAVDLVAGAQNVEATVGFAAKASVVLGAAGNDICAVAGATVDYVVATDGSCGFGASAGTNVVATVAQIDLGSRYEDGGNGTESYMPALTSVLVSSAPSTDLGTGITTDQVGLSRTTTFVIGSREYTPPPVFTAESPSGSLTNGTAYSYTFVATGVTDVTYALASGSLPPGMTFDPATGVLSGTPTTDGSYTFTISASNAGGVTTTSSKTIEVASPPTGKKPNAPQRPDLVAGSGRVKVTVARGSGGGTPTSFTVTSTPGGQTCTVTSSSGGTCTVTGLTNGVMYTFKATASNANGTSDPSQASQEARPGTVPTPGPQPVSKRLRPGKSRLLVDGVPTPVMVEPSANGKGVTVSSDDFAMDLDGLNANGKPMNLGPDGVLVLAQEREVLTNGEGFLPNTDVKLYVDPEVRTIGGRAKDRGIFIGKARTDNKGEFSGTATLPAGIANGVHDIQAVGVSKGNLLRVMTLGVLVSDVPHAVRDLAVDRALAKGVVFMTWDAPRGSKRVGIEDYQIQYRFILATAWISAGTSKNASAKVTDLIPGCRYDIRVRARNQIGVGEWKQKEILVPTASSRMRLPSGDLRCLLT